MNVFQWGGKTKPNQPNKKTLCIRKGKEKDGNGIGKPNSELLGEMLYFKSLTIAYTYQVESSFAKEVSYNS